MYLPTTLSNGKESEFDFSNVKGDEKKIIYKVKWVENKKSEIKGNVLKRHFCHTVIQETKLHA